jgi:hypothetical protein
LWGCKTATIEDVYLAEFVSFFCNKQEGKTFIRLLKLAIETDGIYTMQTIICYNREKYNFAIRFKKYGNDAALILSLV